MTRIYVMDGTGTPEVIFPKKKKAEDVTAQSWDQRTEAQKADQNARVLAALAREAPHIAERLRQRRIDIENELKFRRGLL